MKNVLEIPNNCKPYKDLTSEIQDLQKRAPFDDVINFCFRWMVELNLPLKFHWRVYLDLADIAKREAKLSKAKLFFKLAITNQPYAY